ncbi:MAG TPA: ParB N-terminal domain-containing protein [Terriglobales bacterium]|jgi:hypothetical protein
MATPAFNPNSDYQAAAPPAFDPGASYQKVPPAQAAAQSGILDREIPLDSYAHATEQGLQNIGRGVKQAVQGAWDAGKPPQTKGEAAIFAIGGPPALASYRMLHGVAQTAEQATEVPGAIHDINQSADPTGTYLGVAGRTAGEGAGQALTALGTEGAARVAPEIPAAAEAIKDAARTAVNKTAGAVRTVDPDVVGIISPRAAHSLKVAQRAAKVAEKYTAPVAETAAAPEAAAAEDFREPGTSPQTESAASAAEQETPTEPPAKLGSELSTAKSTGAKPQSQTGEALSTIKPRTIEIDPATGKPEFSDVIAAKQAPAPDTSPAAIQQKLNDALGGKPLQPNVPLKNQIPAKGATAATSLPEGFTSVKSSAMQGYKYDPETEHFEIITPEGSRYGRMGITPDQVAAFEGANSKGRAWQILKDSPGVINTKNGAPRAVRVASQSATPDDVAPGAEQAVPAPAKQTPQAQPVAQTKAAPQAAEAPEGDLTDILQKSLEDAQARKQTTRTDLGQLTTQNGKATVVPPKSALDAAIPKGGVSTTAAPADLTKRWGVDEKSIVDTDSNLRGMNAQQSQDYINKLAESYKKGRPVEPVMETRDANNNIISVDGRHRAIAAQKAGIQRIPVIVRRLGSVQ